MTIRTTGPVTGIRGVTIEDYQTPWSDFIQANMEEAVTRNPLASSLRWIARRVNEEEDVVYRPDPNDPAGLRGDTVPRQGKEDRFYTADQANALGKPLGLKFDRPVHRQTYEAIAALKRKEVARQAVFAQGENRNTYGLGTLSQLFATAIDPLNIATAFVPVIREARFAALTARVGKTVARGIAGGVEGAVGAALVEPIVLGVAYDEQADYDLYDSLINVAFGGVLGGGLHIVGGKVVDIHRGVQSRNRVMRERVELGQMVDRASAEAKEAALRVAVAEMMQNGRVRSADVILSRDPAFRTLAAADALNSGAPRLRVDEKLQVFEVDGATGVNIQNMRDFIPPQTMKRADYVMAREAQAASLKFERAELDDLRADVERLEREVATSKGKTGNADRRRRLSEARKALAEAERRAGDVDSATAKAARDAEAEHREAVERSIDAGEAVPERVLEDYPDLAERAAENDLIAANDAGIDSAPVFDRMRTVAEDPQAGSLPDYIGAANAAERLKVENARTDLKAANDIMAEEAQKLSDLQKALGVEDRMKTSKEILEADAAIKDAEDQARALEAAALCQMRRRVA